MKTGHRFVWSVTLATAIVASSFLRRADAQNLDLHEVTNAQYQLFVKATGHAPPEHWSQGEYSPGTAKDPVVLVNWYDAVAYCRWDANKRVPSAQEWQASCSAGKIQKLGDVWEWTTTEMEGEGSKVLCGPQGTCECTHFYQPSWKNTVKGFRCAADVPLAMK